MANRTAQTPEIVLDDTETTSAPVQAVVRQQVASLESLHGTKVGKVGEELVPVWIAFLTNGIVKQDGTATMGVGMGKFMRDKYPTLAQKLGEAISGRNNVIKIGSIHAIAFPHQAHWRNPPIESMILQSAQQLMKVIADIPEITPERPIYVERPGYHISDPSKSVLWENNLDWKLGRIVDNRVVFVLPERAGPREISLEL